MMTSRRVRAPSLVAVVMLVHQLSAVLGRSSAVVRGVKNRRQGKGARWRTRCAEPVLAESAEVCNNRQVDSRA